MIPLDIVVGVKDKTVLLVGITFVESGTNVVRLESMLVSRAVDMILHNAPEEITHTSQFREIRIETNRKKDKMRSKG